MALQKNYLPSIGLEIHAQLLTQRKMFSPEATSYGQLPNSYTSPITLAHPGTMPAAPNKKAIELGIKMGLAFHSTINRHTIFARKNYFYPDLAKGYQITQDKTPLCTQGYINLDMSAEQRVRILRVHLEEDTAKSLHNMMPDKTLLDFNRAGTPLIEIVTEPDIHTPEEAYECLMRIRRLVRYLGICDGNMEEGSLRCDVNVSVRKKNTSKLGTKVEVKNLNSMRHVKLAAAYEIARQIDLLERGETVVQSTRSYDAVHNVTVHQRTKETLSEYRYFPEPDLMPVVIAQEWVDKIKTTMPLLPHALNKKFIQTYHLTAYDADVLVAEKSTALFYEALCKHTPHYKAAANWVIGPIKAYLKQEKITADAFPIPIVAMAKLINMVEGQQMSFSIASSRLFPLLTTSPTTDPQVLAEQKGLLQSAGKHELEAWVQQVLTAHPEKVEAYKKGKKGLISFFMGQVMKLSKGKAHPKQAMLLLQQHVDF